MNNRNVSSVLILGLLLGSAGLAGCEQKGPVEQVGEEVDEAVDTMKNGKESTANKLDDAADDVREGVNDAADELKGK